MKTNLEYWSMNDVLKLYQTKVNRQSVMKAEKVGRIPTAERTNRGLRAWKISDLPDIGKVYGFLKPPESQIKICVYTGKGGVLKTTISYTLARMLALHGIKTLIVGLDFQCSITSLGLTPLVNVTSLENLPVYKDVGDVLFNGCQLKDVIQKTSLPTLDILPETDRIAETNNLIGTKTAENSTRKTPSSMGRHEYFTKFLLPQLKEYQVIIFDNSPSWSYLIENSLFAADYVISPTACDPGSYQVLNNNLNGIYDFGSNSGKEWKRLFLVPTLKDKSKLSGQIHASYITNEAEIVTENFIRRSIRGSEAFSLGVSPIEFDVASELSEDYYSLVKEIWGAIQKG